METTVFWIWNGWGILTTALTGLFVFFYILATVKAGADSVIRMFAGIAALVSWISVLPLNGWAPMLLALPIATLTGILLAAFLVRMP